MDYNSNQTRAIESDAKRIMCLAGAGSGKTAVLTERMNQLNIKNDILFENMLCLTFTRLAGQEMKERILNKNIEATNMFANTFHSFGCQMIEDFGYLIGYDKDFTIYDNEDEQDVILSVIFDLAYKVSIKKYYSFLNGEIEMMKDYDLYTKCETIKKEFYSRLKMYNAIHLDGILEVMKKLLLIKEVQEYYHNTYEYVFVDEAQDNNQIQTDIIDLINPDNLFVVGDINQSIYGWRGAVPENFSNFPSKHKDVEVITLNDNYRSTTQIVESANNLIKKKELDYDVNMIAHKEGEMPDVKRYATYKDELLYTMFDIMDQHANLNEVCVLTRNNREAREFAEVCEGNAVPFNLIDDKKEPLKDNYIKELLTIIKAAHNRQDTFTTRKLVKALKLNIPSDDMKEWELEAITTGKSLFDIMVKRSSDDVKKKMSILNKIDVSRVSDMRKTFSKLVDDLNLVEIFTNQALYTKVSRLKEVKGIMARWAEKQMSLGYRKDVGAFLRWLMLRDIREKLKENNDGINIMTIHKSKGLEFDHIYIISCNKGVLPSKKGDPLEELNLMYVALTRARNLLTLSYSLEKTFQWNEGCIPQTKPMEPSRYINDIMHLSLF